MDVSTGTAKAIVDDVIGTAPDRPQLQVIGSDLPATARALRTLLAANTGLSTGSGLYDRGGVLVRLAHPADGGLPSVNELTVHGVVFEAHHLCQPVQWLGDQLKPITLPERVAKMYLEALRGEWGVPALDGVTTAPVLAADGAILDRDGYDSGTHLWCARVPALRLPDRPTRKQAEAALMKLRQAFRTFPFGDAPKVQATVDGAMLDVVDTGKAPMLDETAALAALLTAVCRPSLHLAPGFLATAANLSGAGAGKGLLVRAIVAIAFGIRPSAFTPGREKDELDKRLVSELIGAAPVLFLDNVNNASLKSDTLASVLTERPARVRVLGKSLMIPVNSAAFIALTGNGLTVSEDLARRFLSCVLDAGMEDPEARPFAPGYLDRIMGRRPELLAAALTIWRWGRQNPADLTRGLRLGSFETWCEWVRDPLLTLGCADPVQRSRDAKANDPRRRQVMDLYNAWDAKYGALPMAAKTLDDDVRAIVDPAGRGRQFVASELHKLAGTRSGGFVLERHKGDSKWGTTRYVLTVADQAMVDARAEARRKEEPATPHQDGPHADPDDPGPTLD